jgi:hypothetical protein
MPPVRRYAGFGNEAVFGTAVPAEFHVDMQSASLDAPSGTEMYYGGGLGRGIRTRRPGYYRPEGNVVYAWDIRTITHMLRWALGGYVFAADAPAPGTNRHEIFGSDEVLLPSFTSRIGKDVFEHVFAGCVVDSLELDLASDFLLATMAVSAQKDSKAVLQAEADLLLPDEFPLAFHEVSLELPTASDVSADVRALKLTIANNLRGDAGRGIGSRFPRRLPAGQRDVTVALDLWYEDTERLESFWGAAAAASDNGAADLEARIVADAGADGQLAIDLPSAHFSQVQTQPQGRDEIVPSHELRAIVGDVELADASTRRSELLVTVENGEGNVTL